VKDELHSSGTLDPKEMAMAKSFTTPISPPIAIPVREILPWLIFAVLLLVLIYFVGIEEGATSIIPGMYVHEYVHDGRHLLGFPCH
jgi:cobalt transporter subunit CbtB